MRRRMRAGAALLAACLLTAVGCSPGPDDGGGCAPFAAYGSHPGTTVRVLGSIVGVEAERLTRSLQDYQRCTGTTVRYEASAAFEREVAARVAAGSPPDLAVLPQPGLLAAFVESGALRPLPPAAAAAVRGSFAPEWARYGAVGSRLYGVPLGASVKSFVWYSPALFRERGYQVPRTWREMVRLTDTMAGDGLVPWCAGAESGRATGWPLTDWLEDAVLRVGGPEFYDAWVRHEVPFDDTLALASLERVGDILKNPRYVNGGFGGVRTIATTRFQSAGLPILDGRCGMHRQGSAYASQWPDRTRVAEDGDAFVFYLPPVERDGTKPVLAAGEFVGAFTDRPEVAALQGYLASPDFVNRRAALGNWISASDALDPRNVASPVNRVAVQLLQERGTVLRFDGSDLMPSVIGTDVLWRQMTDWVLGASAGETLGSVEAAWPSR